MLHDSTLHATQLAMPARADEPLMAFAYYVIIPTQQAASDTPLCLNVTDDSFEEMAELSFAPLHHRGSAHFRLSHNSATGGTQLLSRNSGKTIAPWNNRVVQVSLDAPQKHIADLDLVPVGQHQYQLCRAGQPRAKARVADGRELRVGARLEITETSGTPLTFYMVPATLYEWLDRGELPPRAYQNATELALRAALGGVLSFAGDKFSSVTEIPGGSMALSVVMSLIWPEKTLDAILQEFRRDLIEDMRRLMATEAMITATNLLLDNRRKYAMEYRDTKRMNIDASAHALPEAALRYAGDYGKAILGLLPGVMNADGTVVSPIAPEHDAKLKAGLAVYIQGALEHVVALQECALMGAFNPDNVIRFYPRSSDGRYLQAGADDQVKLVTAARERTQTMSLVMLADGALEHGDLVAFKANNGNYLSAWRGSMWQVVALRKERGEWETFRIHRLDGPGRVLAGDRVALMGSGGFCVSVDAGDSGKMTVNGPPEGKAQSFVVSHAGGGPTGAEVRSGSAIGLQAHTGRYLSAINGGGEDVLASSPHLSGWETFTLQRLSVGTTLRYGSWVAMRRPADGRFGGLATQGSAGAALCTSHARITPGTAFRVLGGPVGQALRNNDVFQLQAQDQRFVTANAAGELQSSSGGSAQAFNFHAEIVDGHASQLSVSGEPTDWIASYATSYAFNIQTMMMHLLLKRLDCTSWERNEVAKIRGYTVIMKENQVGRVLYRAMETHTADFKTTEAKMAAIKQDYQQHLGFNEVMVRLYPVHTMGRLSEMREATEALCNRLRRDIAYSTEFWRQSVLPDRSEWAVQPD